MALKSHKVRNKSEDDDNYGRGIGGERPRRRPMKLRDLQKRVQLRKAKPRRKNRFSFGNLNQVMQRLNQNMAKSVRAMPSDRDVNNWLWK